MTGIVAGILGVQTGPGTTELTRIPRVPKFKAEELGLKAKLEARDDNRLDLDSAQQTLAE